METCLALCGVYMIRCRPTGEFYIGGTKTSFVERFAQHAKQLRYGRHISLKLQAAFDQYGPEQIEFLAIRAWPADEVHYREREAMCRLKPALNPQVATLAVDFDTLSRQSGLSRQVLQYRAAKGLTGDDLIAPPHRARRKPYTRKV